MESKITTTIIVPAYNEEQGLAVVLEDLQRLLPDSFEVIVVDDGSQDNTALVARNHSCQLISHQTNLGKGAALRTGLAAARGERIIFIDADGTYPPNAIFKIADALDSCDIAIGSRSIGRQNIPAFNRFGNFLFRSILRYLYGFRAQDPLTGLYGLHKIHLEKMRLISTGFGIESEIAIKAARMRLKISDIPIEYRSRIGQTKLHPLRDGYRILKTILDFILLYNPTISFIVPGLGFLVLGLVLMVFLLLGPIKVGPITFSIHTTMAATILALAGFQIIVFGTATKLYALAHKFTHPDFLTNLILQPRFRKALALLGLAAIFTGSGVGMWLFLEWACGGFGEFTRTQLAEIVSFLFIFGLQVLFALGFLSIFIMELKSQQ